MTAEMDARTPDDHNATEHSAAHPGSEAHSSKDPGVQDPEAQNPDAKTLSATNHRPGGGSDADADADQSSTAGAHNGGFLDTVEYLGNKLPDPFWLFVIIGGLVLLSSWAGSLLGLSATDPRKGETVYVTNLLSSEGATKIVSEAVKNFTSFPPLGVVMVVMLGVAVAEHSGLISTALRSVVGKVSPRTLTFVLALVGVTGSIASDAIFVILVPLGAMAFRTVGRSPVVGMIVAFAASSAGFNASLILNLTDVLLAGISTSAAQIVDPNYVVSPLANYFFVIASSIVLALIVSAVTEFYVDRKAHHFIDHSQLETDGEDLPDDEDSLTITPTERRALRLTGMAAIALVAVYFLLLFVGGSPLQGPGGAVLQSPLILSVGVPIALGFFLLGVVYGVLAGTIDSWADIPEFMERGLRTLLPMMVLFFAVSQFLAWFSWSNLGTWTAISGASLLQRADLPPVVMFGLFVLMVAAINIFITSGSAQWALMAPVVVPMFMYVNVSPEVTQMLFRMGDSPSNIITPMSPYFALALTYLQRYYRKAGIGTLMSLTLPYAAAMLVGWFAFFMLWYWAGLPLGPGTPTVYPAP